LCTNVQEFLDANPDAKLISLGIGDTTHPLPGPIADAMAAYAKGLGTLEGSVPAYDMLLVFVLVCVCVCVHV